MSDFRTASDRAADKLPAPPRGSHFHQACQHFCFAYGCERAVCQICHRKAANARMEADYHARQAGSR